MNIILIILLGQINDNNIIENRLMGHKCSASDNNFRLLCIFNSDDSENFFFEYIPNFAILTLDL